LWFGLQKVNLSHHFNFINIFDIYKKYTYMCYTGMCVDKIERDDLFWLNNMEMPLSEFYLGHMVPEIIFPQLNINII